MNVNSFVLKLDSTVRLTNSKTPMVPNGKPKESQKTYETVVNRSDLHWREDCLRQQKPERTSSVFSKIVPKKSPVNTNGNENQDTRRGKPKKPRVRHGSQVFGFALGFAESESKTFTIINNNNTVSYGAKQSGAYLNVEETVEVRRRCHEIMSYERRRFRTQDALEG